MLGNQKQKENKTGWKKIIKRVGTLIKAQTNSGDSQSAGFDDIAL